MSGRFDWLFLGVIVLGFIACAIAFGVQATVYVLVTSYWPALWAVLAAATSSGFAAIFTLFGVQSWRWNHGESEAHVSESR